MIKNIIVLDAEGEFDFAAEGYPVEIIEVFEDGISFVNPVTGEAEMKDCSFKDDAALIIM